MASVTVQLRELRQQVERLQVEISGRQSLDAMVVWDGQNQSSVNQTEAFSDDTFSGLIIHLTEDLSPAVGTTEIGRSAGLSENDFERLKQDIERSLDQPTGVDVAATGRKPARRTE